MANDQAASSAEVSAGTGKRTREQSTIQFPYGDLEDAVKVARGLHECGGQPCEPDQLASAMNQSPTSGSFRTRIAAARIFGVSVTRQGKYELTDLGFKIVDPAQEREARADAFLHVPLYRRLYEDFRNRQLPPRPLALQRAMIGFGVAEKQADRARQAFDRSASQAGFFPSGDRNRLVRPVAGSAAQAETPNGAGSQGNSGDPGHGDEHIHHYNGNGGNGGNGGYHPFIMGLLSTLPEPNTVWTIEGRAAWLEAAASAFKLIYKGDGRIRIAAETDDVAPTTTAGQSDQPAV